MPHFVERVPATSTRCRRAERPDVIAEAQHDGAGRVLDDRGIGVDDAGGQRDDAAHAGSRVLRAAARALCDRHACRRGSADAAGLRPDEPAMAVGAGVGEPGCDRDDVGRRRAA